MKDFGNEGNVPIFGMCYYDPRRSNVVRLDGLVRQSQDAVYITHYGREIQLSEKFGATGVTKLVDHHVVGYIPARIDSDKRIFMGENPKVVTGACCKSGGPTIAHYIDLAISRALDPEATVIIPGYEYSISGVMEEIEAVRFTSECHNILEGTKFEVINTLMDDRHVGPDRYNPARRNEILRTMFETGLGKEYPTFGAALTALFMNAAEIADILL